MADCFSQEKRSWVMAQIRSRDTQPEIALRKMLHGLGYRYRLHRSDLPGKPDLAMAKYRALIYVHGCFWHGHECQRGRRPKSNTDYWQKKLDRNIERDKKHLSDAKALGWRPLVVWECELAQDPELVLDRVLQHLTKKPT